MPDIICFYVQVFHNDQPIGVVYLQQFNLQHHHLQLNSKSLVATLVKALMPRHVKIIICGHLFRIGFPGYFFNAPFSEEILFDVIHHFIQQHGRPAGILVKDIPHELPATAFRSKAYQYFSGDVTMEITRRSHWHHFNDYINDLHKDYRQRARKIMAAFNGIVTTQLDAAAIKENTTVIETLYGNVVNKQMIQLGRVNAAYFYELKKDLQNDFEFHALYKNGKMIGFYTFIFYSRAMETHFIGLDYSVNSTHKIYFNVLFAGIAKMIERKFDSLELGRTAREAKANTGAVPSQVYNYIKIQNPVARWIQQYIVGRFANQENKAFINRNPLK